MNWLKRLMAGPAKAQTPGSAGTPSSPFAFDPAGPERAAEEARQAIAMGDLGSGFERGVKVVDRLHDFYVYERFANRRPSSADEPLVDVLLESLRALRAQQPDVEVVKSGVVEATHRLRTISSAVDEVGGDAARYRRGLDELARLAPDVDVSGVFWH